MNTLHMFTDCLYTYGIQNKQIQPNGYTTTRIYSLTESGTIHHESNESNESNESKESKSDDGDAIGNKDNATYTETQELVTIAVGEGEEMNLGDLHIASVEDNSDDISSEITTNIAKISNEMSTEVIGGDIDHNTSSVHNISNNISTSVTMSTPHNHSNTTSVADMDALINTAVLRCCKYIVKDNTLPMLVSIFWAVVLKCVNV